MESNRLSGFAKIVHLESGFGYCYTMLTATTKISVAKVQETGTKVYFTAVDAGLKFSESLLNHFREGEVVQFSAVPQQEQRNCKWHANKITKLNQSAGSTAAAINKTSKESAISTLPMKSAVGKAENSQGRKPVSHSSPTLLRESGNAKSSSDWEKIVSPSVKVSHEDRKVQIPYPIPVGNNVPSASANVVAEREQIAAPVLNFSHENSTVSHLMETKANPIFCLNFWVPNSISSNEVPSEFWLRPTLSFADEMIYHEIGLAIASLVVQLK